jgi:hypothetical protein
MKRLAAILLSALAAAGCSPTAADDRPRGPVGKADSIGTCDGACGDIAAAGDCYCDDACVEFGDCCGDRVAMCVPTAERACAGALFDAHPVDGAWAVEELGAKVPLPLATCGAEMTYLYGLADLAPVAELLAGTGHVPLALAGGKTLVRLFWADYPASDVGAYREVGLVLATVESPAPLPEAPLVNDYTLVAAALAPGVVQFMHRLILAGDSAPLATALGEQLWGLDKRIGAVTLSTADPSRQGYEVVDELGAPIASLVTHEDPSPAAQLAELEKLAAALGLPGPDAFPPPAAETRFAVANQRVDDGSIQAWSATYGPLAGILHSVDSYADSLVVDGDSELGRWLENVRFEPRVTAHYPAVDVVFASE